MPNPEACELWKVWAQQNHGGKAALNTRIWQWAVEAEGAAWRAPSSVWGVGRCPARGEESHSGGQEDVEGQHPGLGGWWRALRPSDHMLLLSSWISVLFSAAISGNREIQVLSLPHSPFPSAGSRSLTMPILPNRRQWQPGAEQPVGLWLSSRRPPLTECPPCPAQGHPFTGKHHPLEPSATRGSRNF